MYILTLLIVIAVSLTVWIFILTCLLIHEKKRTDKISDALYEYYFDYDGREFRCPKFSTAQFNNHVDARTMLSNSKGTYPLRDVVFAILTHIGLTPERTTVPAVNEIKLVNRS